MPKATATSLLIGSSTPIVNLISWFVRYYCYRAQEFLELWRKQIASVILFLPWLITCSGCGPNKGTIDWQADVSLKEKEGWDYEKTFGSPGPIAFEGYGESDTANSLTGYWVKNGQRQTNEFKQVSRLCFLLSFAKTDGDAFLVVMSKEKGKSK